MLSARRPSSAEKRERVRYSSNASGGSVSTRSIEAGDASRASATASRSGRASSSAVLTPPPSRSRRVCASVRAATREDRRQRASEELDVQREPASAHVLHVHAHPVAEADVAAAADLPDARDPSGDVEPPPLPP